MRHPAEGGLWRSQWWGARELRGCVIEGPLRSGRGSPRDYWRFCGEEAGDWPLARGDAVGFLLPGHRIEFGPRSQAVRQRYGVHMLDTAYMRA